MAEPTLKQKTAKGLFWGGLSSGVQQILNLVFGLVLARILNAEDYGMVGMLAIFSAIASTIQESGFTAALTNQKEIRHEEYNAVFWFSTLAGTFFYITLFFCAPLIARFYERPELVGLARLYFLGFLLGSLGIASNAYLFKQLKVKERAKIDITALLCSGIVGVTMALNGFAYYGLALQAVTYVGIGSLLKLYFSSWKPRLSINFQPLRNMFGFGSKLIVTNIFTQINNNVMSVVLGKFYNAQLLGYYSQGQKWMAMGHLFIGGTITGVAQPVLVEVINDKTRQAAVFRKMVRFGAFISFPLMLGLAFVAKELIVILVGEKWLPSVPFLQLFCLWGMIGYMHTLYTNLLMTYGRSDVYLKGMVGGGVLQLAIVLAAYPLGIYPMVVCYIGAYYLLLLFWHYQCSRLTDITFWQICKDILPYAGGMVISIAVSYGIVSLMEYNRFAVLAVKIVSVAFLYLSMMWLANSVIFKEMVAYLRRKKGR